MNSSNQDKSECNTTYDPNAALEFFKLFGKLETIKQGEQLFVHAQKAGIFSFLQTNKTYFLVEGTVTIQTVSGCITHIESGNIFGEFTPYTNSNATATSAISCKLLSLSEKQFVSSLKKKPEFLFMLINVLINYLQKADTETQDAWLLTENKTSKHNRVLNSKMLDDLKQKLGDDALMVVPEKRIIFREGAAALLMYVILEGYMTIIVDNKVVGRSGSGDMVGEIALVAQKHSRTASVVAETRCLLLAINRQTLLELIQTLPTFGISLLWVIASHLRIRHAITK